jgi:response regulator RpfG family c-di-GMP phosphodiesterase
MPSPPLEGRLILIVEDEPLIVLDMTSTLACTPAQITSTNAIKHAMLLVEHDGLAGAILDPALADGDSSALCARLAERGIPFLLYIGYKHIEAEGPCRGAPHLLKPATSEALIAAVEHLINGTGEASGQRVG